MYNKLKYIFTLIIKFFIIIIMTKGCANRPEKQNLTFNSYSNGKHELGIDLPKKKYKEFEPIMLRFTLINHDTLPLKIRDLFVHDYNWSYLVFKDQNGKDVYKKANHPGIEPSYDIDTIDTYIIYPTDTFYISIPINNWGKKVEFKKNKHKIIFNNYGFLKKGFYKFYYLYQLLPGFGEQQYDNHPIRSNEVSLYVEENNIEDLYFLKTILDSTIKFADMAAVYEEMQKKFPQSTYKEYMHQELIIRKGINDDLCYDFEKFIYEYPDSPYLLNDRFIGKYIYLLCRDFTNVDEALSYLNTRISNKWILRYISNRKRIFNTVVHNRH